MKVQFDSFASYNNLNMISIVDVENSLGLVFIFISLIPPSQKKSVLLFKRKKHSDRARIPNPCVIELYKTSVMRRVVVPSFDSHAHA